jgi:Flp pilus assembly protein TadG
MQTSFTLPRLIAIPLSILIVGVFAVLFSVVFAILLIPVAIIGFKFWRALKEAKKAQNAHVFEAEYIVLKDNDDEL